MGFLGKFFERRRQTQYERDSFCIDIISEYRQNIEEIENFLKNELQYLDPEISQRFISKYEDIEFRERGKEKILKKSHMYGELVSQSKISKEFMLKFKEIIPVHNEKALKGLIELDSKLFFIEGKEFDQQQKECIVKDVHNHMVISGAGTGKTMTIVGKVAYLIKTGKCDYSKILVLSFTNKTAVELRKRIRNETGHDVEVSTFHKLGLNVLRNTLGHTVKVREGGQFDFIMDVLNEMSKEEVYCEKLLYYESELGERNRRALWAEMRLSNEEIGELEFISTKKAEIVRSYGERDIANFLDVNNINYVYEAMYKVDESDVKYRPDFYLPDHGIYIEYYGVDRDGKVPSYFSAKDGKTPSEAYNESMLWKRNLHMEKGTKLVEVFAYERWEGTLLSNLRVSLEKNGVIFPKDPDSIIDKDTVVSISRLFESLLNRMKSRNLSIEDIQNIILDEENNVDDNKLVLFLFEPVFEKYQKELREKGEVDYNDMINLATKHVSNGDFVHNYEYVLIDEYQDISSSRINLLMEMRKVKDFKIFCVGDDWQSIYGFTGSNLSCLYDFQKYWGIAEESKEETTYRFPKKLIEVSSKFVLENPKQIYKELRAQNDDDFNIVEIRNSTEEKALNEVLDKVIEFPEKSTVFFLGRYKNDKNILFRDSRIECHGAKISIKDRYDINAQYLTVHNAKGLQADCVVLLNNRDGTWGFPSKMVDSPIIKLLNEYNEGFPFSEERRAYYVAFTRAKKTLILLTVDGKISSFVKEIKEKNQTLIEANFIGECPMCGGRLLERRGQFGSFFGCSNFSLNNCKYKEKMK